MANEPKNELWNSLLSQYRMLAETYGGDLAGDVCLKAVSRNYSHPGSIGRIVRSTRCDQRRSENRRRHESLSGYTDLKSAQEDPPRDCEKKEANEIVARALDQLDPKDRELIHLKYRECLTDQQIADRLSIPIGTARTREKRVRKKLKPLLRRLRP